MSLKKAQQLYDEQHYSSALQEYIQLVETDPRNSQYHHGIAQSCLQLKQYKILQKQLK